MATVELNGKEWAVKVYLDHALGGAVFKCECGAKYSSTLGRDAAGPCEHIRLVEAAMVEERTKDRERFNEEADELHRAIVRMLVGRETRVALEVLGKAHFEVLDSAVGRWAAEKFDGVMVEIIEEHARRGAN